MSEPYEPRNPNTQLYLRAKWLQEWSPILTVVISCLALAVVGLQSCIYNQQRRLMNEQKAIMDKQSQTMSGQLDSMDKTLAETQKSADAAVASADAAKISAKSTADMAAQNKELIKAAKTQADASLIQAKTSQVSARAAEASAQFAGKTVEATREATFTANRAYVTVRQIHPPQLTTGMFRIVIDWDNDGNSPGRMTDGQISLMVWPHVPMWKECVPAGIGLQTVVVQPRSTRTQRFRFQGLTQSQVSAVGSGEGILNICGRFSYETLGQSFPLTFCAYWDKDSKEYLNCEEGDEK
jgi:hypothetical protein